MTERICTIPGCQRLIGHKSARGWCSLHYKRWQAHGDPLADVIVRQPRVGTCSTEGCGRAVAPDGAKGMCRRHYDRLQRAGTTTFPTVEERFWAKVDKTETCWLWTGTRTGGNLYGYFRPNSLGGMKLAHRIAYELLIGLIPAGLELHHRCERPECVRPDHLQPVTHRENMQWATKPHCRQGHPYDEANTYVQADGTRRCRICKRAGERVARARRQARSLLEAQDHPTISPPLS
jgi:hypothetical protein